MKSNATVAVFTGIVTALVLVLGGASIYLFVENQKLKAEVQQLRAKQAELIESSTARTCQNNLRRLDSAAVSWMLETSGPRPTRKDLLKYFSNGFPECPSGGTYTLTVGENPPTCSIPSHKLEE